MAICADNQQLVRVFESDLTSVEHDVTFNGNEYSMHLHITAFGEGTVQAIDWIALLTENTVSKKSDHFRKLVDKCDELYHGNKKLRDHIQVIFTNLFALFFVRDYLCLFV
jgi:hypothetical protein